MTRKTRMGTVRIRVIRVIRVLFFHSLENPMSNLLHGELTEAAINAFYHVYNTLGYGFLPSVYSKSLAITLSKRGFKVSSKVAVKVFFEGEQVGFFYADLIVNDKLVLLITSTETSSAAANSQLINYLRASPQEVGLVLNFGVTPEFSRKVFTNDRKPSLQRSPVKKNTDHTDNADQH